MTFLAPILRERVQLLTPTQTANADSGGFDMDYTSLMTVWGSFKSISFQGRGARYIRGGQTDDEVATTDFTFRRNSFDVLGKAFSSAFDAAFNSIADLNTLKSNYFLFVQRSSTVKGRLFKIDDVQDKGERREFLSVTAIEIEEQGTGYTA